MDTATMLRMFKYMKEHNDELVNIIAARCPNCDKMTEEESEAFCNAVIGELMHVDGLIDEQCYQEICKVKKITLTQEELKTHIKWAVAKKLQNECGDKVKICNSFNDIPDEDKDKVVYIKNFNLDTGEVEYETHEDINESNSETDDGVDAEAMMKKYGFAFTNGPNSTKQSARIVRELNEFVQRHRKECANALRQNFGNKIAQFNAIEAVMKKLEPDTWQLVRDFNYPPKTEVELSDRVADIVSDYMVRHKEECDRMLNEYDGDKKKLVAKVTEIMADKEPILAKRISYLMQKFDEDNKPQQQKSYRVGSKSQYKPTNRRAGRRH